MKRPSATDPRARTSGITLLETMVASVLMGLLVLLVAQGWAGFGRPTADLVVRSRLVQEAHLAITALAGDLGGCLSDSPGRLGVQLLGRFVGRLEPGNSQLWLCFDGGLTLNGLADWGPPDTVIVYEVQNHHLIRWDQATGIRFTVASNVDRLECTDLGGGRLQIQITLSYRDLSQTYTLIARDP